MLSKRADLGLNGRVGESGAGSAVIVNKHVPAAAPAERRLREHVPGADVIVERVALLWTPTMTWCRQMAGLARADHKF